MARSLEEVAGRFSQIARSLEDMARRPSHIAKSLEEVARRFSHVAKPLEDMARWPSHVAKSLEDIAVCIEIHFLRIICLLWEWFGSILKGMPAFFVHQLTTCNLPLILSKRWFRSMGKVRLYRRWLLPYIHKCQMVAWFHLSFHSIHNPNTQTLPAYY